MRSETLIVDPRAPDANAIARAVAVLRDGGLVAFPTETVYGLGAHALDPSAVARIFAAKGRPATNPVIVHVHDIAAARRLVRDMPEAACRLAERLWPGPLTLVLPKSECVPDAVTAGGPTVAVRVPAHPVALALLRACDLPLAAPSANPSSSLSPTTAEHVRRGLGGKIDLILDGGPTPGGLESTVLDVSLSPPRLLRPGLATIAEMEAIVGPIQPTPAAASTSAPARSPGMLPRHYAPRTPLEAVADGRRRVEECRRRGERVGWITWRDDAPPAGAVVERLPANPTGYAAFLYASLHRLDEAGLDRIVVDLPPAGPEWLAVHDRLQRASA